MELVIIWSGTKIWFRYVDRGYSDIDESLALALAGAAPEALLSVVPVSKLPAGYSSIGRYTDDSGSLLVDRLTESYGDADVVYVKNTADFDAMVVVGGRGEVLGGGHVLAASRVAEAVYLPPMRRVG